MRVLDNGNFLLGVATSALEVSPQGVVVKTLKPANVQYVYKALPAGDGGTWFSAGYESFIGKFDAAGKQILTLKADVAHVNNGDPNFYAGFQLFT